MGDLRYGLRSLLRNPGFTGIAVLALALGIGANTAIFSIIHAVLLRPLPCKDPERVVLIGNKYPNMGLSQASCSVPDYFDRRNNQTLDEIAATTTAALNLTGNGEPERVFAGRVTASFFPLMGVEPILGRWISPDEDQPGRDRVAVLSYRLWQRRFGADRNVLNRSILLDGRGYTVVGVMPTAFQVPFMDLFVPIAFTPEQKSDSARGQEYLLVFGRMKRDTTLERVRAEMETIAARVPQMFPDRRDSLLRAGWGAVVEPLREQLVGSAREVLLVLFSAVGFVLLIACANVASLLLARAAAREREVAVRLALGAGPWRLVRLLLAESLLLALLGGIGGLLLAGWTLQVVPRGLPAMVLPLVEFLQIGIDARVFAFTLALSAASGVLFGLAPARQALLTELHASLRETGRASAGTLRRRLRGFLVVAEVALALILLIGAGLLFKSLQRVLAVDPGFQPGQRLTAQISLPAVKYPNNSARAAFIGGLLGRIRALPGVREAAGTMLLPLMGGTSTRSFWVEDYQPAPGQSTPLCDFRAVTPGFVRAMGMRLLRGREFDQRDVEGAPLAVMVDEKTARRFWPSADPVGKRLRFGGPQGPLRTVVGVVGSVKNASLEGTPREQIYAPYAQQAPSDVFLVVHTTLPPMDLVRGIRTDLAAMDRDLPLYLVRPLAEVVEESLWSKRLPMQMLALFSAVALGLAAVGIYGVISYSVSQRIHEIGIRMALGAERSSVLSMVVRQGMTLALAGVCVGLVGSFALTRFMKAMLYGVSALDPAIYASLTLVLCLVAAAACYVPARRATRVDPLVALRHE